MTTVADLDLFDLNSNKVGKFEVSDTFFLPEVNSAVLYEVVKNQLANRRRGTHCTKTKAEVRGGGKKPWKQKHTGRARQGSTRNPHWVGGGRAFGPKPRDYSYSVPKKVRRLALRSALTTHFKNGSFFVLDNMSLPQIKTKLAGVVLEKFKTPSALFVDVDNQGLMLSVRNLPTSKYLHAVGVNVYDLLNYKSVLISKAAMQKLQEFLANV